MFSGSRPFGKQDPGQRDEIKHTRFAGPSFRVAVFEEFSHQLPGAEDSIIRDRSGCRLDQRKSVVRSGKGKFENARGLFKVCAGSALPNASVTIDWLDPSTTKAKPLLESVQLHACLVLHMITTTNIAIVITIIMLLYHYTSILVTSILLCSSCAHALKSANRSCKPSRLEVRRETLGPGLCDISIWVSER